MCSLSPSPPSPLCASLSSSLCLYVFHFSLTPPRSHPLLPLLLSSVLSPPCVCLPTSVPVCGVFCCILISKCSKRLHLHKKITQIFLQGECPWTSLPDFGFVSCHLFHYSRVCRSADGLSLIYLLFSLVIFYQYTVRWGCTVRDIAQLHAKTNKKTLRSLVIMTQYLNYYNDIKIIFQRGHIAKTEEGKIWNTATQCVAVSL